MSSGCKCDGATPIIYTKSDCCSEADLGNPDVSCCIGTSVDEIEGEELDLWDLSTTD